MTDGERLTQAEAALHDLLTGRMASVFVDQNGERVEYRAASLPALRGYVAALKSQIGGTTPPTVIRFKTSKGL